MNVTMPDGTVITDVPEGTTQSQLTARYAKLSTATSAPQPAQPKTGIEHAADAAGVFASHPFTAGIGMAENALSSVTGGAGSLADAVTGADPGAHDWGYRPRTEAGQQIARLGADEGAKAGQKYDKAFGTGPLASTIKERGQEAMGAVGTITALGGLRAVAGAGKVPRNVGPRSPAGLRGAVPGEEVPVVSARETSAPAERPAQLAKVPEAAPSKAELKNAAKAAYKKAEDAGVVITPESFDKAKGVIGSMLEKEGLDPTLHPATTAALKRINETSGPVTLDKLETLRRIAKSAESTINPADRRLAAKVIDTIDGYADTLSAKDVSAGNPEAASAFREARNYYSRARKADELDELMSRAELSAPNFSASGMENAVRTEFRNLAKNQRRMRLFTADERAAIVRVAKGGKVENALRMLGKFAPTGSISTAISAGSGFMAGGPLGAIAVPAAGAAARYGATRMTMRNAARANELVRRGPSIEKPNDVIPPPVEPVAPNASLEIVPQSPLPKAIELLDGKMGYTKFNIRSGDGTVVGGGQFKELPDKFRLYQIGMDDGFRGKGHGIAAYKELADMALERGKPLFSDTEVSASAANAYEALKRRGYVVEKNPSAKFEDGVWSSRGWGVYRVIAKPSQKTPVQH